MTPHPKPREYASPFLVAAALAVLLGTISTTLASNSMAAEVSDHDYYEELDSAQQTGTTTPNVVQPNSRLNTPQPLPDPVPESTIQLVPVVPPASDTNASGTSIDNTNAPSTTPLLDKEQERRPMDATDGRVPVEPNYDGAPMSDPATSSTRDTTP